MFMVSETEQLIVTFSTDKITLPKTSINKRRAIVKTRAAEIQSNQRQPRQNGRSINIASMQQSITSNINNKNNTEHDTNNFQNNLLNLLHNITSDSFFGLNNTRNDKIKVQQKQSVINYRIVNPFSSIINLAPHWINKPQQPDRHDKSGTTRLKPQQPNRHDKSGTTRLKPQQPNRHDKSSTTRLKPQQPNRHDKSGTSVTRLVKYFEPTSPSSFIHRAEPSEPPSPRDKGQFEDSSPSLDISVKRNSKLLNIFSASGGDSGASGRPVALLQHGLFSSSANFVLGEAHDTLGKN